MNDRNILEGQMLAFFTVGAANCWHCEYDIEDRFVRQGYERDLVQEIVDMFIDTDMVDFFIDHAGNSYLAARTTAKPAHWRSEFLHREKLEAVDQSGTCAFDCKDRRGSLA